jgi:hypothetical protein
MQYIYSIFENAAEVVVYAFGAAAMIYAVSAII